MNGKWLTNFLIVGLGVLWIHDGFYALGDYHQFGPRFHFFKIPGEVLLCIGVALIGYVAFDLKKRSK